MVVDVIAGLRHNSDRGIIILSAESLAREARYMFLALARPASYTSHSEISTYLSNGLEYSVSQSWSTVIHQSDLAILQFH